MSKNNYINVALISGAGVIGGLINYIYHPIMLKFLTLEEFGTFGSLVGIFNILGILVVGFDFFLNKTLSQNLEDRSKIKFIYSNSVKIFTLVGIVAFLLFSAFSFLIADFLKINSIFLVVLAGFAIVSSFLGIANSALLKSFKSFGFLAFLSVLGPIFKLIFGILLVYIGFGVFGALIGFIISGFLGIFLGFYYLFGKLKNSTTEGNIQDLLGDFYTNKKEIIHFFILSFLFASFMNMDVILAKNIFSASEAGIYAGIGVLGKFLIFLLLSVETVYFGQIMEHKKEKLPTHLIKNPLIIITFLSVSALVFNHFFGAFILHILKPELVKYLDVYLWSLVFYGLLAFMSFFIKVLIGWKKYYINSILSVLFLVLIIIVYTFGKTSLVAFVQSFVGVGFVGFMLIGACFLREMRQ